jgi:RNA polymerase sigma factor (sigma-70 family)
MDRVPTISKRPKTFPARTDSQKIRVLNENGQIVWRTKNELVEQVQGMVGKIARTYRGRGLTWEELVQAGNVGVAVALNQYDLKKGCQFSTIAFFCIRKEIQKALTEIRRKGGEISLDQPATEAGATLSNAIIDHRVPDLQARILCEELLSQLSPKQRTIVELRAFGGLTFPEIGEKMGRARPTVQKVYNKAVKTLKQTEA